MNFTALWSAFNAWYNEVINDDDQKSDRQCIEELKWSSSQPCVRLQEAIQTLIGMVPLAAHLQHEDATYQGYHAYLQANTLTRFVQAAFESEVIRRLFYVGDDNDQRVANNKPQRFKIHCAPIAYCGHSSFQKLYRAIREAQADEVGIIEGVISVQQAMTNLGLGSAGSVFFPIYTSIPLGQKIKEPHQTAAIERAACDIPDLSASLRLRRQKNHNGAVAGVIELLYTVRNAVVHGGISPADPNNDVLIEAAYRMLDEIVLKLTGLGRRA